VIEALHMASTLFSTFGAVSHWRVFSRSSKGTW
jgi:hypothetical protein